jgi:hypothetical protein
MRILRYQSLLAVVKLGSHFESTHFQLPLSTITPE